MTLKRHFLLISLLFAAVSTFAQQSGTTSTPVTKDPQAVAILNQSLSAVGGLTAINSIQDYTGTGSITYYWAAEEIQFPATVRGSGSTGFRLDATLPTGVRTWACSGFAGVLITPDGKRTVPSFYNQMISGSMTLPYLRIAAVLSDTSTSITYLGTTSVGGQELIQVHFSPAFGTTSPGHGKLPGLGEFDVFFDPTSFLILKLTETAHADTNYSQTYSHEIDFSNYQKNGNLSLPLTITEKVAGQTTWSLTLSSISFNGGLTADIFAP